MTTTRTVTRGAARPQLLDEEHDNLRAALGRALRTDPDEALRLAVSLWRFWLARGHFAEGSSWLERALPAASPRAGERSRALLALAFLDARLGRVSRFAELGAAAVAATELVGTPVEVGFARLLAGFLEPVAGNVQVADEIAADGLAQAEALGSPPMAAAPTGCAAWSRCSERTCRRRWPVCRTRWPRSSGSTRMLRRSSRGSPWLWCSFPARGSGFRPSRRRR